VAGSALTEGLTRSSKQMSEQITQVFVAKEPLDQAKLDELEEMLIEADLGPHSAARITERFAAEKFGKTSTRTRSARRWPRRSATSCRRAKGASIRCRAPALRRPVHRRERLGQDHDAGQDRPRPHARGAKVLVVAGDTFRAAAVEQLKVWADRATPTSCRGRQLRRRRPGLRRRRARQGRGYDVVLIDTAGRLQNKQGLMDELLKIIRVVKKIDPDAPHETCWCSTPRWGAMRWPRRTSSATRSASPASS
jgi:fused signal recognition particle receptor